MPNKSQTQHRIFNPGSDSPFFALFEQGRVPSLQEERTIQELLVEKTAHLAHLNSKVPRRRSGKKVPRELRVELDSTRRFIKFHRALISPWRRLPVEIISEIFCLTLEPTRTSYYDDLWNDDRAGTLLLCRICSAWRAIALKTPALWNILSLRAHVYVRRRSFDWASTWLDRSRSFPLYLQLFWDDSVLPENINPVISVFSSHLHHTVGLWIDGLHTQPTFPLVEPSHAPVLSIVGANLPPGSSWDWIHAACRASPGLTRLTTTNFSLERFPITYLTKLHLVIPLPVSALFEILEHASRVQDISIDIQGPSVASSTGGVHVFKSVSRLQITSEAAEHLGHFLEQMELPGLEHISIYLLINWPEAEFLSFLSHSACALTSLDFFDVHITQEQLVACLQQKACNALETLAVKQCDPADAGALLQHLTYTTHPFLCPNLKRIELEDIDATDGLLGALVESRVFAPTSGLPSGVSTPARLNFLRFSFVASTSSHISHLDDWRRLRRMEYDLGLEIDWPRGVEFRI